METIAVDWERVEASAFCNLNPVVCPLEVTCWANVDAIVRRISAGPFRLSVAPPYGDSHTQWAQVYCEWIVPNAAVSNVYAGSLERSLLEGHNVEIGGHLRIDFPTTERAVLDTISSFLKMMAAHEVDEWFKVDGKCHVEPHPELALQRSLDKMARSMAGERARE